MVNLLAAAKSAIRIYAAAIALGTNSSISTSETAAAMAELYLPNFTSFTLGSVTVFPDTTVARAGIEGTLIQFNKTGLGADIRLDHSRVDVVSAQSAICWVTWKIFPKGSEVGKGTGRKGAKNGVPKPWTFVDVYGFRLAANRTGGLEGGWEWSNADDEYLKLAENYPAYFS